MRTYLPPTADRERLESALMRVLATGCEHLGMQHGAVRTATGDLVASFNRDSAADSPQAVTSLEAMARLHRSALASESVVCDGVVEGTSGSFIGVALRIDDGVVGTMCLGSDDPRDCSATERGVMALLGELASDRVAIEAVRGMVSSRLSVLEDTAANTPERDLHRQVALLSRVAGQMPVGAVVTDTEGRIQWANEALTRLTGFTMADLRGQRPRDTLHAPVIEPGTMETIDAAMADRRGFMVEMLCRTRASDDFWAEVTAHPLFASDDTDEGYLVMMVDITERRRSEVLQRATERAVAATLAKSEFLSRMSHEIRTPLNAIVGFAQLLARTPLDARQRGLVSKSQKAADVLLATINEILDFSKIEAGALTLEETPFAVVSVIDEVQSIVGGIAERKGLAFSVDIAPHVPEVAVGDPVRLRQVLINLAGNAVKFTDQGSVAISVSADPVGDDGHLVRFVVADTGVGIAPELQKSLFDAFSQADASTTRRYGGTGLGLSISKRLVDLMAGSIELESAEGHGSMFTVTLPLGAVVDGAGPRWDRTQAPTSAVSLAGSRILLAEDNEFNQDVARELLKQVGAEVDVVADGREAVERIRDHGPYDVVLMDVQMPHMDGLEATRAIRLLDLPVRVPIIAMTANVMAEDVAECFAAGMDDFEPKPLDINRLSRTVSRWVW